jgi:flagellar assembly protein FliH
LSEVIKTQKLAARVRVKHTVPMAHALPELQSTPGMPSLPADDPAVVTLVDPSGQLVETPPAAEQAPPPAAPATVIPREVLDDAFRRGFADGLATAERRAADLAAERIAAIEGERQQFLDALQRQLDALTERTEREALRLALAVAGVVVRREIALDPDTVLRRVREALRRVVGAESITLRVHPEDEALVRGQRTSLLGAADSLRELLVETDDSVERGGCIIESRAGNIDARITTALAQIERALSAPHGDGGRAA